MHNLFRLVVMLFFLFASPSVLAADCQVIYGGGEIACDKPTTTPKPLSEADQPLAETNTPQTKGGLPVHPPTNAQTTPATGAETLALVSLLPIAALGFFLRKKTTIGHN